MVVGVLLVVRLEGVVVVGVVGLVVVSVLLVVGFDVLEVHPKGLLLSCVHGLRLSVYPKVIK